MGFLDTVDPLATPYRLAICGDWHMNTEWAAVAAAKAAEDHADVILHLGDFGYTFSDRYLQTLESVLADYGVPLMFIDGNHEDFPRLRTFPLRRRNGLRELTPHIWHIPRGYRWEWEGIRFMGLGGAHSVDRPLRTAGYSWWPEEALSRHDIKKARAKGKIDVLLSHDCPDGVPIPGLEASSSFFRADELRASEQHRGWLGYVARKVQPSMIYHGHYHRRYTAIGDFLGCGPTMVEGLGCDGGSFDDNIIYVDIDDLRKALTEW